MKNLIIVESPAKARKIQGYFDDGTIVRATCGHIRDLDPKTLSVDIERNFEPSYKTIRGKQKTIDNLKRLSKNHRVILAADDDREGDSIAWHTGVSLKQRFTQKNRIVFHEITQSAIQNALNNIHTLNLHSVDAQQCRRIIDRLVGYSLSPLLWKHIDSDRTGLSAGRVQSTLLTILRNHEQTMDAYEETTISKCNGDFKGLDPITCEYNHSQTYDPHQLFTNLRNNRTFSVYNLSENIEQQYPPQPLITSTLQRQAHTKLRFSLAKTTTISQKLYETGKITYCRTDSNYVSPEFQAKLCNHIKQTYTDNVYKPFHSNRQPPCSQGAHECIRVVSIDERLPDTYSSDERKLYDLIREHTFCSHMKAARYQSIKVSLKNKHVDGTFVGTLKSLQFKGYLEYYGDTYSLQDPLSVDPQSVFTLSKATHKEDISPPPKYLDESSIVKTLETSGIGRPSTYSSIVSTLYVRNYTETKTIQRDPISIPTLSLKPNGTISKTNTKKKYPKQTGCIVLTDLGKRVLAYLERHFSNIIHVDFTSQVEKDLDAIANGLTQWQVIVRKVYDMFFDTVHTQQTLKSEKTHTQLSRSLGMYENHEIVLKMGKFGPYLTYNGSNKSLKYLKKEYLKINIDDVIEYLRYPQHIGNLRINGSPEPIMIHKGPYGMYLKFIKQNIKIPQKKAYTFDECVRYIQQYHR
jgi:DNA topoisomerase I